MEVNNNTVNRGKQQICCNGMHTPCCYHAYKTVTSHGMKINDLSLYISDKSRITYHIWA